ncbi:hypothetical protein D3C79_954690 [compost metagenome]
MWVMFVVMVLMLHKRLLGSESAPSLAAQHLGPPWSAPEFFPIPKLLLAQKVIFYPTLITIWLMLALKLLITRGIFPIGQTPIYQPIIITLMLTKILSFHMVA